MTQAEMLQQLWRDFEREHDHLAVSAREVVDWAVAKHALELPHVDPRDVLATQMARALREEYEFNSAGQRYRVNHAVRITKDGVQHTIWGVLGHADHEHMQMAFSQRRDQVIGDLVQLQVDVNAYTRLVPHQPPIQLALDFSQDVAERMRAVTPELPLPLPAPAPVQKITQSRKAAKPKRQLRRRAPPHRPDQHASQ
jgi:hypothetical protein